MFVQVSSSEPIGIEVGGSYDKYEDDPAYDPSSGNSMTCSYRPDTIYELREVDIDLGEVKNSLENLGDKDIEITVSYEYSRYDYKKRENVPKSYSITSTVIPASNVKLIEGFIYDHAFDIVNDMVEYEGD
jgi:hypothetical protein